MDNLICNGSFTNNILSWDSNYIKPIILGSPEQIKTYGDNLLSKGEWADLAKRVKNLWEDTTNERKEENMQEKLNKFLTENKITVDERGILKRT
jgi:hypothetical protein